MSLLRLSTAVVAVLLLAITTADLVWYEIFGGMPLSRPVHYAALVLGATSLIVTEGQRRLDHIGRRVDHVEAAVDDQAASNDLESLLHLIER